MVKSPPEGMPQCSPVLFYDDVPAAIAFLKGAFAFEERFVSRDEAGHVDHAQLRYGSALVMISPARSPHALRPIATPKATGRLSGCTYLFVDDVDAHARRAQEAGAEVVMPLTDTHYGDRLYCALDPEGHFWTFATHTQDVAPYQP